MTLDEAEKLAGIRGIAPLIPSLNEAFPTFRWSLDPDRGLVVVESTTRDEGVWLGMADGPAFADTLHKPQARFVTGEAQKVAEINEINDAAIAKLWANQAAADHAARIAEIEAAMKAQAQRMHPQATKVPNAVIGYDEYFRPAIAYTTSVMDPTQSAQSLTWPAEDDGA